MKLEQLENTLVAACNEHAFAGLAVAIVESGRCVYAKGFGMADAARGVPITLDTSFRIGSISKTLTAIGLMQLHQRGLFQLDDPVNNFLRAYKIEQPRSAPAVTFRHLLTHTSGLGEFRKLSDLLRPTIGLAAKPEKLPTLREYYAPALKADVAPQVKWAYANHGFATLGQLVEDLSGQPFAEYMIDRVFGPLGMNHTDYRLSERVRNTLAQGYRMGRRGLKPISYREVIPAPAGSIFSSVNDMARYLGALLGGGANDTGRVLESETLATMMTPQYQLDPRMPAMGLAFMLSRMDGVTLVGHDGGWPGFTSAMLLAPENDVGTVVFTNTTSLLAPDLLARELLQVALGKNESVAQSPILEQTHLWNQLCGTYRPAKGFNSNFRIWMLGGALRVFVKRGHLMIGGRVPFGPIRKGLRLYPADPADPLLLRATVSGLDILVLFKRNAAGRIDSFSAATGAGAFVTLYKKKYTHDSPSLSDRLAKSPQPIQ
jgi:CubicO group peptidase (beta-lactamase class C family)